MRTLKLTIGYDGTGYSGWQAQKNSPFPTVQQEIESALGRILKEKVRVHGSGRTDAGVHALAQTAHIRTSSSIGCLELKKTLNRLLPRGIVVVRITQALTGFHARFDAVSKRYRYTILNNHIALPFEGRYACSVKSRLDTVLMKREIASIVGRHDFVAFQGTNRKASDTRRRVFSTSIKRKFDRIVIDIEADGFLYNMVRSIVGTLIDIGRGYRPQGTMRLLLNKKDRILCGPTAPACGLCLVKVQYRKKQRFCYG